MKKICFLGLTLLDLILIGNVSLAQWNASGSDIYYSSGKVGVGTASPKASLHIIGTTNPLRLGYDASNYASFQMTSTGGLSIIPTSGSLIAGTANNTTSTLGLMRNGVMLGGLTSANGVFSLFGGSASSNHLTISNKGQIGVGTGASDMTTVKINNSSNHVFSTGEAQLTVLNSSADTYSDVLVLKRSNALPNTHAQGILFADVNSMQAAIRAKRLNISANYQSDLQFYTGNGLNDFQDESNVRMTIDHSGNVGIGTTSPDAKLTVNGSVHAKEIRVNTGIPVPDYVFEPDYKLQELSILKAYLDANHHLPEIPSAAEVEKNGMNLSEMNLKLLKKVEELTLYLIKLNQENELIKKEVKEIKNGK